MITCGPTALGSGTNSEWTRSKPKVKSTNDWGSKKWFQVRRALWDLVFVSGFWPATNSNACTCWLVKAWRRNRRALRLRSWSRRVGGAAGLEERPRAEDTVVGGEGNPAMEVSGAGNWAEVHWSGRRVAEFRTEVTELRLEDGRDRGTAAEPGIEFLESVVVDQIELDILIAAVFARLYFGFT